MPHEQTPAPAKASVESLDVYVTAAEAYPAFERLFLTAQTEIWASFRVFDLSTALRSAEALAVGKDWFDLFADTLSRGVDITLVLADFDPIVATDLHRDTWAAARKLAGVAETYGKGKLTFRAALHPARAGLLPRLAFRHKVDEILEERSPDELTPGLQDEPAALPDLTPATHHQKLAVFDRKRLYIGGLDLNERRYDTHAHDQPSDETWQDVQVCVTGPVVEAAQKHLETFEAVTEGKKPPQPPSEDGFIRTLSTKRSLPLVHISPKTLCSEIFDAHLSAIARAEGLIYLETQFFRERELAAALAKRALEVSDLFVILLMPAAPEDVAFEGNDGPDARYGEHLQAKCVATLFEAFGDRALVCCPVRGPEDHADEVARLHGSPLVYVHSKVSVFDEREAIVSSGNLNGRSMHWDTEAGLHLQQPDQVAQLRRKVMGHWIPESGDLHGHALFQKWTDMVQGNLASPPRGQDHFLLPYDKDRAETFGQNLFAVPDNMV